MKRCLIYILFGAVIPLCPSAWASLTLQNVVSNHSLWPREVVVHIPLNVPIVVNGNAAGSMTLSAERIYPVRSITAQGVVVEAGGSSVSVSIENTDLLARAEQISSQSHPFATPSLSPATATSPSPTPMPPAITRPSPLPQAAAISSLSDNINGIATKIAGKLVSLQGDSLVPYDSALLKSKKYLVVYYSGFWWDDGRAFSSKLVEWYKKHASDKFDVIFVSRDKSAGQMLEYMKADRMPWPALTYEESQHHDILTRLEGNDIQQLIILDGNGKVLSDTYRNGEPLEEVLKDFEKLIQAPATPSFSPAVATTSLLPQSNPVEDLKPGTKIKVSFPELGLDWNGTPAAMTIRIPEDYSPTKPVPLMVWLSSGKGSNSYDEGAKLVAKTKFLLVGLPYPHAVDLPWDATMSGGIKKIWDYQKPMIEKLQKIVPNIDPNLRIVGGFSNGAYEIGGCLGQGVLDFSKFFNIYILIEGGGLKTYDYPVLSGKRFYYAWGDKHTDPADAAFLTGVAQHTKMQVESHRMVGVGHDFPADEQERVRQWIAKVLQSNQSESP